MNTDPRTPDPSVHVTRGLDESYAFSRPLSSYVSPRQIIRLTIYRSKLYEGLCSHASLARRSQGNMDACQCATCGTPHGE